MGVVEIVGGASVVAQTIKRSRAPNQGKDRMGVLSLLFGARSSTDKPHWLKVEDRTGSPSFWNDIQSLFERAMSESQQTAGAAMYRVAAPANIFYFSPSAADFLQPQIAFLESAEVKVTRCSPPRPIDVVFISGDKSLTSGAR